MTSAENRKQKNVRREILKVILLIQSGKKINLTIFKFNAASKTNSNLLWDVMRTDTNYLMNAIKKHVKNWTPPLTPLWLFGLIKMFSAISSYILLRNQIIFLFLVLRPFVLYNQVVRLFGLLTGLEVLAGQNEFIKTYICVNTCITPYLPFWSAP